jgi:hypothetical protein
MVMFQAYDPPPPPPFILGSFVSLGSKDATWFCSQNLISLLKALKTPSWNYLFLYFCTWIQPKKWRVASVRIIICDNPNGEKFLFTVSWAFENAAQVDMLHTHLLVWLATMLPANSLMNLWNAKCKSIRQFWTNQILNLLLLITMQYHMGQHTFILKQAACQLL